MRIRVAAVVVMLVGTASTLPATAGGPPRPADPRPPAAGSEPPPGYPQDTSDNQPGWIAPPLSGRQRSQGAQVTAIQRIKIAPGVRYTRWRQTDARGQIRAHLLTVHVATRGLHVDYADAGAVAKVATVRDMIVANRAIAGINGDFYDIGRTGAPLGLGRERERGLLHGRTQQPSAAFYLDAHGRPRIEDLTLDVRVVGHPEIRVGSLNSPYVAPDSVGLYGRQWGRTTGYGMTHGQRQPVRAAWIEKGRVVAVRTTLPRGEVRGQVLVGRGAGAAQLQGLRPGMRLTFLGYIAQRPRVLITGNRRLVVDGAVKVTDDRVMHPRTAIGIDRDTGNVLMLVVDGRQQASRGYTMVELANLMLDLGADDALNLDGGGSSTMVARGLAGRTRVVNTPSDGFERQVANGLEITYRKPPRRH